MNLNIGLIDKSVIIRLGIQAILEEHFEASFIEASTPTDFISLYANKIPDAIIMERHNGSQNFIEMVSRIRSKFRHTPLIIFDELEGGLLHIAYLKLGIRGYLLKRTLSEELAHCLREVIAGRSYVATELFQTLMISFQNPTSGVDRTKTLTKREEQIAMMLCKGMRTKLIADSLDRKQSTISTIKQNILKKMNVENVLELAQVFKTNTL